MHVGLVEDRDLARLQTCAQRDHARVIMVAGLLDDRYRWQKTLQV